MVQSIQEIFNRAEKQNSRALLKVPTEPAEIVSIGDDMAFYLHTGLLDVLNVECFWSTHALTVATVVRCFFFLQKKNPVAMQRFAGTAESLKEAQVNVKFSICNWVVIAVCLDFREKMLLYVGCAYNAT